MRQKMHLPPKERHSAATEYMVPGSLGLGFTAQQSQKKEKILC
jgi:hypothetical protein